MENKSYQLQGQTLKMKKRCLELRKNTVELFGKVAKHINEYTFESKTKLNTIKQDESLYGLFKSNYETDMNIALFAYFTSADNLKELFSKVLEGNIEAINYNPETDEEIDEIISLGVELFNDFFSISKLATKKLKKSKKV